MPELSAEGATVTQFQGTAAGPFSEGHCLYVAYLASLHIRVFANMVPLWLENNATGRHDQRVRSNHSECTAGCRCRLSHPECKPGQQVSWRRLALLCSHSSEVGWGHFCSFCLALPLVTVKLLPAARVGPSVATPPVSAN